MHKLWIVTKETYLRQVKSWSFLTLVLMPFIMIGLSIGIGYISYSSSTGSDTKIAILSDQPALRQQLIQQNKGDVQKNITTTAAAKKKVAHDDLSGYLVLKVKNQQIQAIFHGKSSMDDTLKAKINANLAQVQNQLNTANAKLTPAQIATLQKQPTLTEKLQHDQGAAKLAKTASFWIMVFMVYMILMTYTSITAQEIASEKGTKIMEIIFSSTSAAKYFTGKILGVLLVILTQIAVYLLGGWGGYSIALRTKGVGDFLEQNQTLVGDTLHNLLSINLLFLLLGVVIYTVLAAFCGALVAKAEDAPKAAQPATMLTMLAFFATIPFQSNADQLLPKILSYVPFFSSYFMPIRIINEQAGTLEIGISLIILIATIALSMGYIGHIYEGLMLQTDDTSFWKRMKRGLAYSKK